MASRGQQVPFPASRYRTWQCPPSSPTGRSGHTGISWLVIISNLQADPSHGSLLCLLNSVISESQPVNPTTNLLAILSFFLLLSHHVQCLISYFGFAAHLASLLGPLCSHCSSSSLPFLLLPSLAPCIATLHTAAGFFSLAFKAFLFGPLMCLES